MVNSLLCFKKFCYYLIHSQFCKFMLVGVTNTLVSFIVYSITLFLLEEFEFKYDYMISFVLSFLVGILWSYLWNSKIVFKQKDKLLSSLFRSNISYFFTGIVLTYIISFYLITYIGVGKVMVFFIIIGFTFPINFLLHKYWVFRR